MSVTMLNPKFLGSKTWRFEWSGGTAPYRIFNYENYKYINTKLTGTSIQLVGNSDIQPPTIEVLDANDLEPDGLEYPAQIVAQWRGVAGAESYKIYDTGNAATLATIPEDGRGYYKYNLDTTINDGASINYTVNVIDKQGNESVASNQSFTFNRNPVAPKMSTSYDDGTNTLTVTPG